MPRPASTKLSQAAGTRPCWRLTHTHTHTRVRARHAPRLTTSVLISSGRLSPPPDLVVSTLNASALSPLAGVRALMPEDALRLLPPGLASFSSTTTSRPGITSAADSAAEVPARPLPTTIRRGWCFIARFTPENRDMGGEGRS